MRLTLRFGFTLTRVGLKGGGVVGRNFLAHSERYSLALGRHLASVALATGARERKRLDSHMQREIYMKLKVE